MDKEERALIFYSIVIVIAVLVIVVMVAGIFNTLTTLPLEVYSETINQTCLTPRC